MPNNFPDWSGTWTDVKGFAGKTPWFTENWGALVDRAEDIANVIDTATAGYTTLNARHVAHEATTTEVIAARDGYGTLLLKEQAQDTAISQKLSEATGLTQNLDGNTYRAVNFSNAVDLQDLTTLSQVNAIAVGGGSPSAIPITDLNIGTATANQKIKVNGAGDAIIGVDDITSVTGLDVGTATANQKIKVNGTGDAIIGVDDITSVTGLDVGTATQYDSISVNSAGTSIIGSSRAFGGYTRFNNYSISVTQTPSTQYLYGYQLFNTSRYMYNVSDIGNSNGLMQVNKSGYYLINLALSHFVTINLVAQIILSLNLKINTSVLTYEKSVHQFYAGAHCDGTMSFSCVIPLSANDYVDCQLAITYSSSTAFTLYFNAGTFTILKVRD